MDMSRRDALIYGGASATSLALSAGECFGKPNPPENGWSVSTEPALYGPTHNPWTGDCLLGVQPRAVPSS